MAERGAPRVLGAALALVAMLMTGAWLTVGKGGSELVVPDRAPAPSQTTDGSEERLGALLNRPSASILVSCSPSHEAPDDPIVYPALPGASHLHQFFGNREVTAVVGPDGPLRASTTCSDPLDHASYWAPVPNVGRLVRMRAYYDAGTLPVASVRAFPHGMKLIAGDTAADRGDVDTLAWSCGKGVDAAGWSATPVACGSGVLRARLTFGQCWDGVLPAVGPASVTPAIGARCPRTHHVGLVRLRLLIDFSSTPGWLASGPLAGMHADFWNLWDQPRLERLVALCVQGRRTSSRQLRECRPKAGEPQAL